MEVQLNSDEVYFEVSEMFFSRTDKRGIIKSGNNFFQEISGYDWSELIDNPHRVLRHPDVPKTIFYYFWNEIKQGRPVGAFVKNQCKDRRYYWVYALALPITDSFISIRVKPTSGAIPHVESIYRQLLKLEQGRDFEQSLPELFNLLGEHGFPSYQEFMTYSLVDELNAREDFLNSNFDSNIYKKMKKLFDHRKNLKKRVQEIFKIYNQNKWLPLNLDIASNENRTFSVVSKKYQELVQEITLDMNIFEKQAGHIDKDLFECLFVFSSTSLMKEMIARFVENKEKEFCDVAVELEYFDELIRNNLESVTLNIKRMKGLLVDFISITERLKQHLLGLDIVRISGKIELGRIGENANIQNLLDDLKAFQQRVTFELKSIEGLNLSIENGVNELAMAQNL